MTDKWINHQVPTDTYLDFLAEKHDCPTVILTEFVINMAINLADLNSRIEIYNQTISIPESNTYNRSDYEIPINIDVISPYFKVIVDSPSKTPGFRYGGAIHFYIGSALSGNRNYYSSRDLLINNPRIVIFDAINLTTESHLVYLAPYWFKDVFLKVYQYQQ